MDAEWKASYEILRFESFKSESVDKLCDYEEEKWLSDLINLQKLHKLEADQRGRHFRIKLVHVSCV